jgi:hypothetical protein
MNPEVKGVNLENVDEDQQLGCLLKILAQSTEEHCE